VNFLNYLLLQFRLFKYSYGFFLISALIKRNSLLKVGQKYISKGDVVLDIGANNGGSTLLLSALVGKNGVVHAFEPNSRIAQQLLCYEQLNLYKNINAILIGIGSSDSPGKFYIDNRPGSQASTFNSLHKDNEISINNACYEEIFAEVKMLDSLIFERVNFIKVDVEGLELEVFQGAINTIREFKPIIYFECFFNDTNSEMLKKKLFISNFFEQLNYRLDIVECFTDHTIVNCNDINLSHMIFEQNIGCELLALPN